MTPDVDASYGVLDFVRVALAQRQLSGICPMLEAAVRAMDAWGAFLWQAHEDSDLESEPPAGSLFVLAEWFPGGRTWALDSLELDSVSGRVIIEHQSERVNDAQSDERVGKRHRWWLIDNKIRCFCSVPVDFPDARASLSFYRREGEPFSDSEILRAQELGRLFPALYQSIRNQVSFDLLKVFEKKTLENQPSEQALIDRTLEELVELVGGTFKSFECSLFLEDRLNEPGYFRRRATTWPKDNPRQTPGYRLEDRGITPWVLKNAKTSRFPDLSRFTPGEPVDPKHYPGLVWIDPFDLWNAIAESRDVSKELLPPLSYMSAPIIADGKVVGAIRCCVATEPPYYYAERELKLLQVAAADIGHYWDGWIRRLELKAEALAWKDFIDEVRKLNERVNEAMAQPLPDEVAIDEKCRKVSDKAGQPAMTHLILQQQNFYKLLFRMIRTRSETENKIQQDAERERRFYEDLFHQLKSPIFTAAATSRLAFGRESTIEVFRSNLLILRGQLMKAERVTRAVQVFAELAKGREPKPELTPLEIAPLLKTLGWATDDHERLFEEKRLRFTLDIKGFQTVRNHGAAIDMNLLTQSVNNLLDNAGKYSWTGTTVRVFGGITNTGRFHISVANKGLRLKPGESAECIKRGWRGQEAKMVTGEGSGLGLWIVDQIMTAHGGQLLVISPNTDDEFEVKLLFHYTK